MSAPRPFPLGPAFQDAFDHTKRDLFQPFRAGRWLVLGLLVFLENCGSAGNGFPGTGTDTPGGGDLPDVQAWLQEHLVVVIALGALVFVIAALFVALVCWINARATFAYVDAVATGRVDLGASWSVHAALANSYLVWQLGLGLVTLCVIVLALGAGAAAILASGPKALLAVALIVGPIVLLWLFAMIVLGALLRDFVAPLQIRHGIDCRAAMSVLAGLLREEPAVFAAYLVVRVLLATFTAFVLSVATCLTCCIAALPGAGGVLLQPLFHFGRALPLHLLGQLGHGLVTPPSAPPAAGLSLAKA